MQGSAESSITHGGHDVRSSLVAPHLPAHGDCSTSPDPHACSDGCPLTPAQLEPDEMQAYVREMLQTNGGCELPCWWGIIPGKTSWKEMQAAFTDQAIARRIPRWFWCREAPCAERHTANPPGG